MTPAVPPARDRAAWRAAVARGIAFGALWLILMSSGKAGDLAMGAFATLCATVISLRLLPPAQGRVRVAALLLQVPRLLRESVVAGVDVARRAFAREVAVRPGFVDFPAAMPRGTARTGFATITSLLPGSVPAGETDTAIVYHVLDTTQPVVAQLREEEHRLARLLGGGSAE